MAESKQSEDTLQLTEYNSYENGLLDTGKFSVNG